VILHVSTPPDLLKKSRSNLVPIESKSPGEYSYLIRSVLLLVPLIERIPESNASTVFQSRSIQLVKKIRETPRARPDKLQFVSAPVRTLYALSIRQFKTFVCPRACVPCRDAAQPCDSCRVWPDSFLPPYRRVPPRFGACLLSLFCRVLVSWYHLVSPFLLVFFLNCVHIAYFSISFGSHSHSLLITSF
jgi:hypothetical protein